MFLIGNKGNGVIFGPKSEVKEMLELYALLSEATKKHRVTVRNAAMGQGIDRHLLGLRVLHAQTVSSIDQ